MLQFYKFRQDLFPPQPAREVYFKRPAGRGWPEECPPIRAANALGFDLLANFDVTFIQKRGVWSVEKDIVIESDFDYAASENSDGSPLTQQYAWFWEKGQKLPHVISDQVYAQISNQVKISSFLFLKTDPNDLLLLTDVPNQWRPFRAMSAVVETDWYPASYPWHVVLELNRSEKDAAGGFRRFFRARPKMARHPRQARRRGANGHHPYLWAAADQTEIRTAPVILTLRNR
jgi:hypothetical protein